ncbi:MAG: lamin tail protein [Paenibacillus sp.]|jgi:fibronectin type 3 domain-containing protein|nr:lamin tail protein [Paenibacillus sp.]
MKTLKTRLIAGLAAFVLLGTANLASGLQTASAAQPLPVPALMLTEVVPDSTNAINDANKSVDGYEFFELYNNSNSPVSLDNYKIKYINGSSSDLWPWNETGLVIQPRKAMVVWVKSPGLSVTLEAFNANYGTQVQADGFTGVSGQGLANTGPRTLSLINSDGLTLTSASFNGTTGDVAANLSIVYQYPADGTTLMRKASVKQQATPGSVMAGQAPESSAPSAPAGLTGTPGDREVQLSWLPAAEPDITQYRVVMNGTYTDTVTEGNSVKVTGLTNLTAYSFSVVAVNSSNTMSIPSSIVTVTPQPAVLDTVPPVQPQGLTAAPGTAKVQLHWTPNEEPDIAGYRVYRDNAAAPVATVSSTTYAAAVSPLTGNVTYQFQVTAVDSSGNESVKSQPVTAVPSHEPLTQEDMGLSHNGEFPQYAEFFDVSEQGALVPGLKQGIVPQGMHYIKSKNWIITSSYRDDKRSSVLTITDAQTGAFVKTIHLMTQDNVPYTGHAGGVAVSEKYVWISNNTYMYQLSLDAIIDCPDNTNMVFIGKFKTNTRASYATYSNGVLWSGEYYSTGPDYDTHPTHKMTGRDQKKYSAWIVGYKLDPATDMVPAGKVPSPETAVIPDYIFSVTDRVQGATILEDQVLLSQTNGASNSNLIKYDASVLEPPHSHIDIEGVSVPVWFMDDLSLRDSLYMPSSAEGNFVDQGKAYVLYESGALKIQPLVAYPLDRLQIIDLEAWESYNTIAIQGLPPALKRQDVIPAKAVRFQGEKGTIDVTAEAAWSSSDSSVAAVSPTGTVTAVNPGEAVIQAKYGDQTASFSLQVLPGDTAILSSIEVNGQPLSGFSPSVYSYVMDTPNRTSSVSFAAALADSRASMNINGVPVGSGELFGPVALSEGANSFQLAVTAEDGQTTAGYSVTVNRSPLPAAPASLEVKTDHSEATLSWSANQEPSLLGYHVYVNGTRVTDKPVSGTSYWVEDVHNGKVYDFTVTSVNSFQEESAGSTVSARIKPTNDKNN